MLNELVYNIVYKIFGPKKYRYNNRWLYNEELFGSNPGPNFLSSRSWIEEFVEIIERQRAEKNQFKTILTPTYNKSKVCIEIHEITQPSMKLLAEITGEYDEGCYFGPRIKNYGFDWFEIDLIKKKFNQHKEEKRLGDDGGVKLFFDDPV